MTCKAPRVRLLIASLALLLPACSGGGGDAGPGAGGGEAASSLLFDTGVSSRATAGARVDAVAFERADGSMTDNLLATPGECELVRPDAATRALGLREIPAGTYVAARILLGSGSAWMQEGMGRAALRLASTDLRAPFTTPIDVAAGAVPQIGLRHVAGSTPPTVGVPWVPVLEGGDADRLPLRLARAVVRSVDVGGDPQVTVTLDDLTDRTVALAFDDQAVLLREPALEPLGVAAFVGGLEVGDRLLIDGVLRTAARAVDVDAAVDLGPSGDASEDHGRLGGVIVQVEDGGRLVDIAWTGIDSGRGLLPDPLPSILRFDAADARIKWVPRHRRHPGLLEEDALRVGMTVVVLWHGAASSEPITADRIDIRSDLQAPGREIEGRVVSIDRDASTFVVHTDDDRPGNREDTFTVEVEPETDFVDADGVPRLGFDDLRVGQQVCVRGRGAGRDGLRATLVEITHD